MAEEISRFMVQISASAQLTHTNRTGQHTQRTASALVYISRWV